MCLLNDITWIYYPQTIFFSGLELFHILQGIRYLYIHSSYQKQNYFRKKILIFQENSIKIIFQFKDTFEHKLLFQVLPSAYTIVNCYI